VVFGTLIDEAFRDRGGPSVVDAPKGATIGGHAMIIVGYIGGKFLVKNSWGKGWRQGGYAFFTPEYIAWEDTWDLWVPTLGFDRF
jgi:C1A family cysteine protease